MDATAPLLPPLLAPAAAPPTAVADVAAAQKAAQNFEAYFLQQSFESMFEGIGTDTLFGGGQAETIYRSLLFQEYGKIAARTGGIGIAAAVQREILRQQGAH